MTETTPQFTLDADARAFAVASGVHVQAATVTAEDGSVHPGVLVTIDGTDNDTREPTSHTVLLPARNAGQLATELIRHANDATD